MHIPVYVRIYHHIIYLYIFIHAIIIYIYNYIYIFKHAIIIYIYIYIYIYIWCHYIYVHVYFRSVSYTLFSQWFSWRWIKDATYLEFPVELQFVYWPLTPEVDFFLLVRALWFPATHWIKYTDKKKKKKGKKKEKNSKIVLFKSLTWIEERDSLSGDDDQIFKLGLWNFC